MGSEHEYETASDRYADETEPVHGIGSALTGQEAAAAGRAFLIREYGSDEAFEAEIRRGRPRLGAPKRGASPSVRGRLTNEDYAAFKRLEDETGKSQSDLVREGVRLLLERHRIAS